MRALLHRVVESVERVYQLIELGIEFLYVPLFAVVGRLSISHLILEKFNLLGVSFHGQRERVSFDYQLFKIRFSFFNFLCFCLRIKPVAVEVELFALQKLDLGSGPPVFDLEQVEFFFQDLKFLRLRLDFELELGRELFQLLFIFLRRFLYALLAVAFGVFLSVLFRALVVHLLLDQLLLFSLLHLQLLEFPLQGLQLLVQVIVLTLQLLYYLLLLVLILVADNFFALESFLGRLELRQLGFGRLDLLLDDFRLVFDLLYLALKRLLPLRPLPVNLFLVLLQVVKGFLADLELSVEFVELAFTARLFSLRGGKSVLKLV